MIGIFTIPEYFSVTQVAEILGVTEKSVRDFIKAGELQATKVGQWRISQEALKEFLRSRSNILKDKARDRVLEFLEREKPMAPQEERTLVVRDFYTSEAERHIILMGDLVESLPANSNLQWHFFFDEELKRARHIFEGDYGKITQVIQKFLGKLRGAKDGV